MEMKSSISVYLFYFKKFRNESYIKIKVHNMQICCKMEIYGNLLG